MGRRTLSRVVVSEYLAGCKARCSNHSQLCPTQAMPDAHQWLGHLIAEAVDHMQQIAAAIKRGCFSRQSIRSSSIHRCYKLTVVPDVLLIVHATGSLVRRICHPDRADPEPVLFTSHHNIFPQRLIYFLGVKSTFHNLSYRHSSEDRTYFGVSSSRKSDERDIARLRIWIVDWCILFHEQLQRCVWDCGCMRILSNVLSVDDMLCYREGELSHGAMVFLFGERRWYSTISELQLQIVESDSITYSPARGCKGALLAKSGNFQARIDQHY